MNLEFRSLKSKVARRVFLLFVTCALLPIVVLSIVGSRSLVSKLNAECRRGLHRDAKSVGMEIMGRIGSAESELRLVAAALDSGLPAATTAAATPFDWATLTPRLRGVTVIADGQRRPLFGAVGDVDLRNPDALQYVRDGGVLLSTESADDDRPGVFLGLALAGRPDEILVGEIDGDHLWGLSGDATLPADSEVLVLDGARRMLFRRGTGGPESAREVRAGTSGGSAGELAWEQQGRRYLGFAWDLFLAAKYDTPSWRIVVGVPRSDVLAPLSQVAKMLPLVALLCLTIVVLASAIQIRRVLVPLESLRHGSERLARREFQTRVQVDTEDEFRDLADAFNSMAADLDKQFRSLTTRAEIDRAILSAMDESRIIATILMRTPEHLSCESVAVMVLDTAAGDSARTYVPAPDGSGVEVAVRTTLDPADRRKLVEASDDSLTIPRNEIPSWLAPLAGGGSGDCVVLPFSNRKQLSGCIALGYADLAQIGQGELDDAKRLANQAAVALSNARLIQEIEAGNWQTLRALARVVDANSPWTAGHSDRVTEMALRLGKKLKLSDDEMLALHRGGLLHDIGKIGVPTTILDKPGDLTHEEMALMRRHPVIGAKILEPISAYAKEIGIVLYHHECPDGSGYPEGLVGDAIPYLARILAVADVFDALTSDRPYRRPWSIERTVTYIRDGAGRKFDAGVVTAFFDLRREDGLDDGQGVDPCAAETVG